MRALPVSCGIRLTREGVKAEAISLGSEMQNRR
jgi:hypothetical protein